MVKTQSTAGHRIGGLFSFLHVAVCAIWLLLMPAAGGQTENAGASGAAQPVETRLRAADLAELKTKAESGEAVAQFKLGMAYLKGNGVPENDETAYKWFRKAADQGNADAENVMGTMYRLGQGVGRDKEEAVRWYQKAARHGSANGMFNLGTCHYNGDGVGSNEFTAYVWFLLAQDAGDPVAQDAVKRSETGLPKDQKSDAYLRIADMYQKGEELPRDEVRTLSWLRKAADLNSAGKVGLAVYLLTGPEGTRDYAQALGLCKAAAKDFVPALPCIGYIYRKGLGAPQDSVEAAKWYEKAAARSNPFAMMIMAEMYATGEGMKVDRPSAFVLLFRCSAMGVKGAKEKANALHQQLSKTELQQTEQKLRKMHFDPAKVFASLQPPPPEPHTP